MKKIFPLLCLTLLSLQAKPVDELILVDVSITRTLDIVSELLGKKIELHDEFPEYRLSLHVRNPVKKSVVLEMLTDLLLINGVRIEGNETTGYTANWTEPTTHGGTMADSLEKRLGSSLWQMVESNNDEIGSIILKNESTITLITLLEQVTGRTALISVHVEEGQFSYDAKSVTKSKLIQEFDSLLRERHIYMHAGRNDTLKFLPEQNHLSDPHEVQTMSRGKSESILPRRRVIKPTPVADDLTSD